MLAQSPFLTMPAVLHHGPPVGHGEISPARSPRLEARWGEGEHGGVGPKWLRAKLPQFPLLLTHSLPLPLLRLPLPHTTTTTTATPAPNNSQLELNTLYHNIIP
jgi:hypothetical protein